MARLDTPQPWPRAVCSETILSSAPEMQSTGQLTFSVATTVAPVASSIQKNSWKKARPDSGPNLSNTARCSASGTLFKRVDAGEREIGR